MNFIIFEGDETEIEFLDKCVEQWEESAKKEDRMVAMMELGSVFHEMKHRIQELKEVPE